MLKKILSIRYWIHILKKVYRLLVSPRVPLPEKLLFAIPVLLYWILPDFLPFMPVDDIAVTMLAAGWFARRMERKYH